MRVASDSCQGLRAYALREAESAAHGSRTTPEPVGLLRKATVATVVGMGRVITQRELRNDSAAILREVQAGQRIIVTRNGVPVAELRPVEPRRFVPRAVIAETAGRAPRVDARRFRADLDAVVDQAIDG